MKILVLGSVNVDHVYSVAHFIEPAETLGALSYSRFAGGKGYNQTMALARAGAQVSLLGMIGDSGEEYIEELERAGADVSHVGRSSTPTGHAIIEVAPSGQNRIMIWGGANVSIGADRVSEALKGFAPGDWFLTQNETSSVAESLEMAKEKGLITVLNPSPYNEAIETLPLHLVDLFIVNELEAAALSQLEPGAAPADIAAAASRRFPSADFVLTLGADGAMSFGKSFSEPIRVPAVKVEAVDTTAAGDTFTGYYLEAKMRGRDERFCLERAARAAAISVTRHGASPSIPLSCEISENDL